MTRVLVVGSGAREHALAWAMARSPQCSALFCAPGNGGTTAVATNLAVAAHDVEGVVGAARAQQVDLVVIGPDAAIAAGTADACGAAGIPVFAPTAAAGRIESSKEFAKRLMDDCGIPTARWQAGGAEDLAALQAFVVELGGRCAVKADGLALGKGVTVCDTAAEATVALRQALVERRFGEAGRRVVVEERLSGHELSVLALSDGRRVRLLPPARDYKRAHDGDAGPNTGGMGAYAPASAELLDEARRTVVEPCVTALAQAGTPYAGCLYAGLMVTDAGLRVLEFNARFGDPEAQAVLPLLDEDVLGLLLDCAHGRLPAGEVRRREGACVAVVAAAAGYPGEVRTGDTITGPADLDADALCFHAGTARGADGMLRTAGGRVLTVVACGADVTEARERAYANIARIRFSGMRWRSDIAALPAAVAG